MNILTPEQKKEISENFPEVSWYDLVFKYGPDDKKPPTMSLIVQEDSDTHWYGRPCRAEDAEVAVVPSFSKAMSELEFGKEVKTNCIRTVWFVVPNMT